MLTTMLRSIQELYDYEVFAMDAQLGRVKELYVNDEEWRIQSIGVDAEERFGRDMLYVPTEVFEEIDPSQKALFIQLNGEELRKVLANFCTSEKDPHLKRARRLTGFDVHAKDGMVGKVEELLLNDADLSIRYLVVDAITFDKRILLSPWWIERIDWEAGSLHLAFDRERICQSPLYDFRLPLSEDLEEDLHQQFGRQSYWR
jgi:sporulation protein YlmC with PRC-barrel domain